MGLRTSRSRGAGRERIVDPIALLYPPPEERTDLRENFFALCAELEHRIEHRWDNLVVYDGEPRCGKSMGAFDTTLELLGDVDLERVAFSADDVFKLYRQLQPGEILLYDEAVLGLLSHGGARDAELTALIQALSIVGVKRITMIACIPDIRMLDSFVKYGRARYWVHVYARSITDRGYGRVHRAWRGARYRTSVSRLPFDLADDLSPVRFRNLSGTRKWRDYEKLKIERVDRFLDERAIDPTGKMARCPRCSKQMTKWNLAEHAIACKGVPPAAPAATAAPSPPKGAAA